MQFLGLGMQGSVFEGNKEGIRCAVKLFSKQREFNKELVVMKHIQKRGNIDGVVELIDYNEAERKIFMELVRECIPLEEYVRMDVMTPLDRKSFMKTLLNSVFSLIDMDVDHGDFKSKNILISVRENKLYLHDFGLSKIDDNVSFITYKYRLFIIFLQIFLEIEQSIKLLIKGFTSGRLKNNRQEGLQFTEQTAFEYPLSFSTIYNLTKVMKISEFKEVIDSDFARKFLNIYQKSNNIEDYRILL